MSPVAPTAQVGAAAVVQGSQRGRRPTTPTAGCLLNEALTDWIEDLLTDPGFTRLRRPKANRRVLAPVPGKPWIGSPKN